VLPSDRRGESWFPMAGRGSGRQSLRAPRHGTTPCVRHGKSRRDKHPSGSRPTRPLPGEPGSGVPGASAAGLRSPRSPPAHLTCSLSPSPGATCQIRHRESEGSGQANGHLSQPRALPDPGGFPALVLPLRPIPQRLVHRMEAGSGLRIQTRSEQRDEKPGKLLSMNEPTPVRAEWRDAEKVLAIEQPRQKHLPLPPQLSAGGRREQNGTERHGFSAFRLDRHRQFRAHPQLSFDTPYKRVPLGIGREVSQDEPDAFGTGVDPDFAENLEFSQSSPSGTSGTG
jgi:hypothetical protein